MSALRLFEKFAKLLDVSWGSIADGQLLKRSGTNIIGVTTLPPVNCPAGTVLQTKYVENRAEIYSTSQGNAPYDISFGLEALSLSITPLVATSKIQIMASGMYNAYSNYSPAYAWSAFVLFAGSTFIAGTYPGGYSDNMPFNWVLDMEHSPGAGAITYSVRFGNQIVTGYNLSTYLNGYTYVSQGYNPVTSMTLMEIKQ